MDERFRKLVADSDWEGLFAIARPEKLQKLRKLAAFFPPEKQAVLVEMLSARGVQATFSHASQGWRISLNNDEKRAWYLHAIDSLASSPAGLKKALSGAVPAAMKSPILANKQVREALDRFFDGLREDQKQVLDQLGLGSVSGLVRLRRFTQEAVAVDFPSVCFPKVAGLLAAYKAAEGTAPQFPHPGVISHSPQPPLNVLKEAYKGAAHRAVDMVPGLAVRAIAFTF